MLVLFSMGEALAARKHAFPHAGLHQLLRPMGQFAICVRNAMTLNTKTTPDYPMEELKREATIGSMGTTSVRSIPVIDFSDYENRRAQIADDLWNAATQDGFFQVINHGILLEDIDNAFAEAKRFFALPMSEKEVFKKKPTVNAGWEYCSQVRPSTGTPDNKESYQITLPEMDNLWPDEQVLPGFQAKLLQFEEDNWQLAMKILSCFAEKLGFEKDFFAECCKRSSPGYQCTLRLIHYMSMENAKPEDFKQWRAGAHSDFDCLTLLHLREGEGGLQLCPGNEISSNAWTEVTPVAGAVTCNIGDMLMRWSDDKLKSTLHRVRMPQPGEYLGPRLSVPFFCQANREAVIEGPEGKYPPITAEDYIYQRLHANFVQKHK